MGDSTGSADYDDHAYRRVVSGSQFEELNPTGTRPKETDYPKPLDPVDDLPPITVITHVTKKNGKLVVRGTTSDNGIVKKVMVNGKEAKEVPRGESTTPGNPSKSLINGKIVEAKTTTFSEWEIILDGMPTELKAYAEDIAGNIEKTPHTLKVE